MAKGKKKRADGRLAFSFTYDGKRYYVYGYSNKELKEKELKNRTLCEQYMIFRIVLKKIQNESPAMEAGAFFIFSSGCIF